eukprot:gene30741-37143_t
MPDQYKWLLVSIFVAVPIALELILDYDQLFDKYEVREGWLGMLLLIVFFIAPNAIVYIVLVYRKTVFVNDTILVARFALSYIQHFVYVIGMMVMMFGHKADYPRNDKHAFLNFSVEKRTVNISLVGLVGRFLYSLGSGLGLTGLQVFARMLAILASALVLLLTVRMLYMLVRQYLKHGMFLTHHHLSDFMYCITLFIYVSLLLALRSYNILKPPQSCRGALNILLGQLFLQIMITCFVQLISGRRNKKLAQIKHEKLETRLNLIRYVSHEMRTPLNTAFMGLTLAIGDLKSWTQKMKGSSGSGAIDTDIGASRDSNTPRDGGNMTSRGKMTDKLQSMSEDSFNLKSSSDERDKDRGLVLAGEGIPAAPMSLSDLREMIDTVGQVNESCKVALSTLDDLLTFDKIDEQKLVIEMQEINPWTFVCAAAKPFAINARQAQVHFHVNLHDRESAWVKRHVIKGDVFKLSQVLRNLISNALKFTPIDGTVEVRLQRDPTFSSKDVVRISVTDTGAGISLQNQKKLFGQYVQFNAAQLQQGKGSGLGLWITKSIVEMHKGHIGVISEGEGMGSMFYVDLPLFKKRLRSARAEVDGVSRSLKLKPSPLSPRGGTNSVTPRRSPVPMLDIEQGAGDGSRAVNVWDSDLNPDDAERPKSARVAVDPLGPLAQNLGVNVINLNANRVIKQRGGGGKAKKKPRGGAWSFWGGGKKSGGRYGEGDDSDSDEDIGHAESSQAGYWHSVWNICGLCADSPRERDRGDGAGGDAAMTSQSGASEPEGLINIRRSFFGSFKSFKRTQSGVFLNNPVKLWVGKQASARGMGAEGDSVSIASLDSNDSSIVSGFGTWGGAGGGKTDRAFQQLVGDEGDNGISDLVGRDNNLSMIPEENENSLPVYGRTNSFDFPPSPSQSPTHSSSRHIQHTPSMDKVQFDSRTKSKKSSYSLLKAVHSRGDMEGAAGQSEKSKVRPSLLGDRTSSDSDYHIKTTVSVAKLNTLSMYTSEDYDQTVYNDEEHAASHSKSSKGAEKGKKKDVEYLPLLPDSLVGSMGVSREETRSRGGGSISSSSDSRGSGYSPGNGFRSHGIDGKSSPIGLKSFSSPKSPLPTLSPHSQKPPRLSYSQNVERKDSSDSDHSLDNTPIRRLSNARSGAGNGSPYSLHSASSHLTPVGQSPYVSPNGGQGGGIASFSPNSSGAITIGPVASETNGDGNSHAGIAVLGRYGQFSKSVDLGVVHKANDNNSNDQIVSVMSRTRTQPRNLTAASFSESSPEYSAKAEASQKRTWNSGLKVLVVDDSGPNRKICAKLMTTHKHEVYEAQDGKHCLEIYDQH